MKGAGKLVKLSKRLETVVSFVTPGGTVADVGTDHGFVPIELVSRGLADGAIAMDVGAGPLLRAGEHIRRCGLEDRIEVRLCDGVAKLKAGEADTVIIAGMGGGLVIHILEEGRHLWKAVKHWILSPQSELDKVRKFLYGNGFDMVREDMVEDGGKYYTVMDAVFEGETLKSGKELTPIEYLYGPGLIEEKNPVLLRLLEREERQLSGIIRELSGQEGEKAAERRRELEETVREIRKILYGELSVE